MSDLHDYVAGWTCALDDGRRSWYLLPTAAGGQLFRSQGWLGFQAAIAPYAPDAGIEPGRGRVVSSLPAAGARPAWPRLRPEFPAPQVDGDGIAFAFSVPYELAIFGGHFATAPIVPGAMLAGWASELAREHCGWAHGCRFVTLLKFRHIVQPGLSYRLRLTVSAAGTALEFDLRREATLCAQGALRSAPP